MTAFHMYALNAVISLYGLILFIWWWKKTGRATEIYVLMIVLFGAELIQKSIFTWLRYMSQYGSDAGMAIHRQIVTHPAWWLVGVPTTSAFLLIVVLMTGRIFRSHRSMRQLDSVIRPPSQAAKSVLVISNIRETRNFMRGLFATNYIEYLDAETIMRGIELLIVNQQVSVVLVSLRAIDDDSMTQTAVVKMIKKERPWCVVVAMTRTPNMYELAEARRAFFDDYIYLPVRASVLIMHFERWISRVNRWKRLDFMERRKTQKGLSSRRGIQVRRQPISDLESKKHL